MTQEVLKLALEALETYQKENKYLDVCNPTIRIIKEALAQPEQEPVQWGVDWGKAGDIPCVSIIKRVPNGGIEVMAVEYAPYSYTTPPKQEPLTKDRTMEIANQTAGQYWMDEAHIQRFRAAVEAAHGIKE